MVADGKIIIFKQSPVVANGTSNTVYMTNYTQIVLHTYNIRKYKFMTMQYRQSLNGCKYIQLTVKNRKIHQVLCFLNVLVHVKLPMLTIVLVELVLKTFTQSVS